VVTSEPIDAQQLRDALGEQTQGAEVMVVAPALHETPLRFWVSDADEAIERAKHVERESVGALRNDGVDARGDTGDSDLVEAIGDALATFPADRVLVFTRRDGQARYREDVSVEELRERFAVPVEQRQIE
jgi:hypothetical protein